MRRYTVHIYIKGNIFTKLSRFGNMLASNIKTTGFFINQF